MKHYQTSIGTIAPGAIHSTTHEPRIAYVHPFYDAGLAPHGLAWVTFLGQYLHLASSDIVGTTDVLIHYYRWSVDHSAELLITSAYFSALGAKT